MVKAGYAVVEVTVTEAGGVRDVKLLEEWPENYGFGKSAVKAAIKLKYNPRVINGVAVEVQAYCISLLLPASQTIKERIYDSKED